MPTPRPAPTSSPSRPSTKGGNTTLGATAVLVKPADALIVNAGPDQTVTAGATVSLSGSYNDSGGTVSSGGIAWDTNYNGDTFNPVITGTLTPTTSYATPGTYQVALQITDSTGAADLSVLTVTVNPVSYTGPTAAAGNGQTINEGSTVSFSGSYTDPDGTVSSSGIAWDFNYDGSDFNADAIGSLTPTYQFTTPGVYTVALQVTDNHGVVSLSTLDVTVNNVAPSVTLTGPSSVTAGASASFTATAADPGGSADALSYAWDFNYDGTTFSPGAADMANPSHVFTTAGTYTVAVEVFDSSGDSTLQTMTVTVGASPSLVVNAGADQEAGQGDTLSFAGSWSDASGNVDPSTADWDFNYNGSTFNADPSAHGTLTPTHTFADAGTYRVALRLTDSNNVTAVGTLYVSVADAGPTADAGADQTVAEGTALTFTGTATDPGGSGDLAPVQWDFDYDGETFNPDSSAAGNLTPTHTYTAPGSYEVALQATDRWGASSLSTAIVTVTDVAPTASVSNSGATAEGSPVTFTVSNLHDVNPDDTVTYLADWAGSGTFEALTSDELTTNPDGSVSFSHTYDDNGSYAAVVRVMDGSGGYTDYASPVTVTNAAPWAVFAASGGGTTLDPTTPLLFTSVSDPSHADMAAGLTYFVSVDGGPATGSASPVFNLPGGIAPGQHTVSGYVQDKDGAASPVQTLTVNVQPASVSILNVGSGEMRLTWDGQGTPVTVDPNQVYTISGAANNLAILLATGGGNYQIYTTGSIGTISTPAGVQGVTLSVNTVAGGTVVNGTPLSGPTVGAGSIGEIDLPAASVLSVNARGDLGNVLGPSSSSSLTGATAIDLYFANLTGSITGLDHIHTLSASGWLGQSPSEQVAVARGIDTLMAYGIGATVEADTQQNAGDAAATITIGDGGVTGAIDAGTVGSFSTRGDVNVFQAQSLKGLFQALSAKVLDLGAATANALIQAAGTLNLVLLQGNKPVQPKSFKADTILALITPKSLTVQTIQAETIGVIHVGGDLTAGTITGGSVTWIGVVGRLGGGEKTRISFTSNIGFVVASGTSWAQIISTSGNIGPISIGEPGTTNYFSGSVIAKKGNVGPINVAGSFWLDSAFAPYLVYAGGTIRDITAGGELGTAIEFVKGGGIKRVQGGGVIQGASVGNITATTGNIGLTQIKATAGSIGNITAMKSLMASLTAKEGDVGFVEAQRVQGDIVARAVVVDENIVGGNIKGVRSAYVMNRTISADMYLGSVIVFGNKDDPKNNKEKSHIFAAGGRDFISGNFTPLTTDVGSATFLGEITIRIPNALVPLIGFIDGLDYDGEAVLKLTDASYPTGGVWTLKAPDQNALTLLEKAVFIPMGNVLKLNKNSTVFQDDGWSITEP